MRKVYLPWEAASVYEQGATVDTVSERYGVSDVTARRCLVEMGVVIRPRPNPKFLPKIPRKQVDLASLVSAYMSGKTLEELKILFGIGRATISQRLAEQGIVLRGRGTGKIVKTSDLISSYLKGETIRSIASRAGLSVSTVRIRIQPSILAPKKCVDLNSAEESYLEGQALAQIAKVQGVTVWAVTRVLKQAGVKMRDNYHPDRREQSRRMMADRMTKLGWIRMGKYEPAFCAALEAVYGKTIPQYQIEKSGHRFDAYAGGVLWELDEKEHKTDKERRERDLRYDARAKELGYVVKRVWEWDFLNGRLDYRIIQ